MSATTSTNTLILIAFLATGLVGCGSSPGPDDLPRAAVAGSVSLDGKPIDGIDIIFESDPVGEHGRRRAVHTTVRDGKYSFAEQEGPAVGNATVRLLDLPESREQVETELNSAATRSRRVKKVTYPVPEKYASGSTLQVQIVEQSLNTHDFHLQSR